MQRGKENEGERGEEGENDPLPHSVHPLVGMLLLWDYCLSDMMGKKELKQKVIKLPRNSNAARSGIFACKEYELCYRMVEYTCTKNQSLVHLELQAAVSNDQDVQIGASIQHLASCATVASTYYIGLMSFGRQTR